MQVWPNHDWYDSQTAYHCAYTIIKPGVFEMLFLGHSKGPQVELFTKDDKILYWDIETKTHDVRIHDSGKIEVRKKDWPDYYPVDDTIFGVQPEKKK